MKFTFGLATLALLSLPSLASATGGCNYDKSKQALSCAAGTTYDSATRSCVPTSS
ncbi:MAG: hypothetical protein COW54_01865 [Rhodobacteraceae bacterium CG17_big_fil_post_rev_8_21_14_2_50_63_15]|nr:hypothetical protein [Roseovarius sp.]PIV79814.1 MAG: hypothetical protein COW54_01865 [Rhodobacteraceae bacterium CG17_big_fil_post_rev_8_21_14_2_50_63_15]